MTNELQLFVLGRPRIQRDGQPLTELVSAKAQALLIYLALTGKTCSRSALAGLLWGDMPEETARANLRLTLTKLRKFVGDHLTITWQEVAFNPHLPYRLDATDFLMHASRPEQHSTTQLQASLDLYRGDFLDDFALHQAPEFEEWALVERERLRQIAGKGWLYLAKVYRQRGEHAESIAATRQLLALEPWHEEGHQQLIWLLAHNGQRSAALAQFEVCRRVLDEELGIEPAAEMVALVEQIKRETGTVDFLFPPLNPLSPTVSVPNLPTPLTPFIGREVECAQITDRLTNPACRSLTLLGPGGIGKTRLALAAAAKLTPSFPDGIFFVPLAGGTVAQAGEVADVVIASIAAALHYTFTAPQPPRDLLLNYLADKTILLVLDNMEQWRAAAKLLTELLRHAPHVKLLITSRERLGVAGEWLYEVSGLPYTSAQPGGSPAAELFGQSARRMRPDFDPSAEAAAINRICALVEGSPLGLELAAGWVRVLSCAEIVARLENSLDLLQGTSESVSDRHQSMRIVLNDSWTLLTPDEQQVFAQLSVFQGGCDLAAAEQVTTATPAVLAGLTDKSWLRRDDDGRYRCHELLRQYGAEQLKTRPEDAKTTHQKHSLYYTTFMAVRQSALDDRTQSDALTEIDPEVDNLRVAWEWVRQQADTEAIATYLEGLWRYFERKGWFAEATFVLEQAVQLAGVAERQRGRWQKWWGEACYQMGQIVACEEHLTQALHALGETVPQTQVGWGQHLLRQVVRQVVHRFWSPISRGRDAAERQQLRDAAAALSLLGPIMYQSGDGLSSLTTAFWALNLAEQAGESPELARAYGGCCITTGSVPLHAVAEHYRRLALDTARRVNNAAAEAYVLELAGLYQMGIGRWGEAEKMLIQASADCARLELRRSETETLSLLAKNYYFQGQFSQAWQTHQAALTVSQQQGDPAGEHWNLLGLVECALPTGQASLTEILAWLKCAEAVQHNRSLARADLIRYYGLLALVQWHRGEVELAVAAAESGAALIKGNTLAGVWTIAGFTGVTETYLRLWEMSREDEPIPMKREVLVAAAYQACQSLHTFAHIFPLAQPRAWLCQGWHDWLAGDVARAHRAWQKALSLAEQFAMPYEQGLAHFLSGRHATHKDQREAHLQQAYDLFGQLGAKEDRAWVSSSLGLTI